MAGNIISGLAPAVSGAGKAPAGFAQAGEAADPLGIFGALVDSVAPAGAVAALTQAAEPLLPEGTDLAALPVPPGVEFTVAPPARPEVDGKQLLDDLVKAMETLDKALADGEPVDPERAGKLSEAVDAIAGMLGIPLPREPVNPVLGPALGESPEGIAAPRGAAGGEPDAPMPMSEIDTLLALAGGNAPTLGNESTLVPPPAGGGAAPAIVFTAPAVTAPAVEAAPAASAPTLVPASPSARATVAVVATAPGTLPLPDNGLPAPAAPSGEAADGRPAVDPASSLGQLVEKLDDLARTLAPRAPGLARRLEALVDKLGPGEVDSTLLVDLGFDDGVSLDAGEIDQAIARLLGASSEVKGTPAPRAFAATQLKLPEIGVPPKASATAPDTVGAVATPAPATKAEAAAEAQPRLTFEPGAGAPEESVEPQPAARSHAAETRGATARPETPAEQPPGVHVAAQATVATPVAGATRAVHAAYQAPPHQINLPQVAFEVVRQFQAGNSRFQIRLDPPELGRIDVRLDVDQSGNVNARMTVERAETLDLMQRDQRTLERALAQAGLDSGKTSLEFSLRQNPFGREDGGDGRPKGSPFAGGNGGNLASLGEDLPEQTQSLYRGAIGASGVNLFV